MTGHGRYYWLVGAAAFTAAGAGLSLYHMLTAAPGEALDGSFYVILALAAGWLGALAGGAAAWRIHRRSPLAPMFENRFGWHYRQRYWVRFALIFSAAWVLFVVLCLVVAVCAGEYEEARTFFTPQGMIAVALFVLVFGAEGAVLGGVVDLLAHLGRKQQ